MSKNRGMCQHGNTIANLFAGIRYNLDNSKIPHYANSFTHFRKFVRY